MVYWPLALPVPLVGRSHPFLSRSSQVTMESARIRVRRDALDPLEIVEVSWNFTEDQFEEFKTFFEETLLNGSQSFQLQTLDTGSTRDRLRATTRTVAFLDNYRFSRSDNLFNVGGTLEVVSVTYLEITRLQWEGSDGGELGLFPALFTFECSGGGNFVTTEAEEGEFTWDIFNQTFETAYAIAEASLEEEGLAQLNCSAEVCDFLPGMGEGGSDVSGSPVEASLPFETQCIGGFWYSEPLLDPESGDRWTVNQNPEGWDG